MNKTVVYVLLGIFALGLFSNAVSASWTVEAGEIPYQANHSDRIVIGTVKSASSSFSYTDVNSNVLEQVNIIFINSSYLKNLQGTKDKEVIASKLDSLAHSGKTMIALGNNPEILYEYVKPNSMFIDLNSRQQEILALGVMIFPDNTSASRFMPGNISQAAGEMFIWVFETTQMGEKLAASNPPNSVLTVPITQEKKPQDTQEAIPLTDDEKTKVIEVAKNDPKVKESLPIDAEVIAVEIPQFAGKNDKIYNVIFKHGEFHDIITVNLTSGNVENSVSIRGEYQPKVEDIPMPVFREDVIVYFKEMPESLDDFASKHSGKLIYYEEVLMFAGFEVSNISEYISKVSTDPYVSSAHPDGIGSIFGSTSGDLGSISGETDVSKAPGFEGILTLLLLISMV